MGWSFGSCVVFSMVRIVSDKNGIVFVICIVTPRLVQFGGGGVICFVSPGLVPFLVEMGWLL